ncbi:MAG: hypothetical protein K2Q20_09425 [Phycisphaerales bacterium]|nr:hypothetical protein [Phycisphaerales bacterium]
MFDLKAALEQQQAIGVQAKADLQKIAIEDGRGSMVFFDRSERKLLTREQVFAAVTTPQPKPRSYSAATLESLVGMVRHFAMPIAKPAGEPATPDRSVLVLVGLEGVEVLLDEADRHDRIGFDFELSAAWKIVKSLATAPPMDQLGIRNLLRTLVGQAQVSPDNLRQAIEAVKFSASTDGNATVGTGKFAESKAVAAELTGAGELPDTVGITAPVWQNVKFGEKLVTRSVACVFDVNPVERKFTLRPKAGEVETAEAEALEAVIAHLRSALETTDRPNVKVFAGDNLGD